MFEATLGRRAEFPQGAQLGLLVHLASGVDELLTDLLAGDASAEQMARGVAQAGECGCGRRRLWRGRVDAEVPEGVDDGASSEQVFDGEPTVISAGCDDRNHQAVSEFRLGVEDALCGCRRVADRAGQHPAAIRKVEGIGCLSGRERVNPHDDACTLRNGPTAGEAPIEAHLVTGLDSWLIHGSRLHTGAMRILLKLELDCAPEVAWRAIRSPAVLKQVAFPLLGFDSLEPDGFPETWDEGPHPVSVKALGLVGIGEQIIGISYPRGHDGAQVVRDSGIGLRGPLALVDDWQHSMAVSPAAGGRTLYRDQLVFHAGPAGLLLWPMYWVFWQWRAFGLKRFAPSWR